MPPPVGARREGSVAYLVPESQITISPGDAAEIKSLSLLEWRARARRGHTLSAANEEKDRARIEAKKRREWKKQRNWE